MTLEKTKLDFLTSSRFWAMIIGAVAIYLQSKGFIGEAEMQLIATVTAGFTLIKTIDKNMGEAKENMTTVSMPNTVSTVTASTTESTDYK